MTSRGGPRALNLFSAFLLGQIGAHREQRKYPKAGPLCDFSSLCPDRCLTRPSGSMYFGDVDMANGGLRDPGKKLMAVGTSCKPYV